MQAIGSMRLEQLLLNDRLDWGFWKVRDIKRVKIHSPH